MIVEVPTHQMRLKVVFLIQRASPKAASTMEIRSGRIQWCLCKMQGNFQWESPENSFQYTSLLKRSKNCCHFNWKGKSMNKHRSCLLKELAHTHIIPYISPQQCKWLDSLEPFHTGHSLLESSNTHGGFNKENIFHHQRPYFQDV